MIWIDSLITTDRGYTKLRDLTPLHRLVTTRGYAPVHTLLLPTNPKWHDAPVVVLFLDRSRSAENALVLARDHPVSVVRPDDTRPVFVRADKVKTSYNLITISRYGNSSLIPIRKIEKSTASVGTVYVNDPNDPETLPMVHNLFASNVSVGFDSVQCVADEAKYLRNVACTP